MEKYPLTPHLDRRADLFKWTVLLHNEVNKNLGKKVFTEAQVIKGYARLGALKRSPIWTPDDFAEADWKARAQGVALGVGVTGIAALSIWLVSQTKD